METNNQTPTSGPADLMTTRDIMILFNVCRKTVTRWCRVGVLKPRAIGMKLFFLRSDVENIIANGSSGAGEVKSRRWEGKQ